MSDGVSETAPAFDHGVTAKLFMHGGSQAVRLPKAFRFEGTEVSVRREGDTVVLEPLRRTNSPKTAEEWAAFWAKIDELRGDEEWELPERIKLRHEE